MYNKIFLAILAAFFLFGFFLPILFSSNTNELPLLGGFIILTIAYFLGKYLTKLHKGDK